MTKDDLEKLLADKPSEVKTRGAVLFNAIGATMRTYNDDQSVSNLRNMKAAKDAFDRFVAELGGGMSADRFDNLHAVLAYLQGDGWKIKKSNLYAHRKNGKIIPDTDGTFARAAVDKYARTFLRKIDTGKRVTEASDELQRKLQNQQERLNEFKIRREARRDAMEEKEIVSARVVKDAAFAISRGVRDAMMNIPDRISEILAAEADSTRVREILNTEIHQTLEGLDKLELIIEH